MHSRLRKPPGRFFDEIDYQRAVQAYLWAYPAVSFESIRLGALRDLGFDLNDFVIADNYADPKAVWLTVNDTSIYALANIDLGKSGSVVVEIPPGAIVGMIDDFWRESKASRSDLDASTENKRINNSRQARGRSLTRQH